MRPSSKTKLLDAAVVVAAREGIAGLTLEAVAGEAGLTKAGLLYHFSSKETMVRAVQEHLLDWLEGQLLAALDVPFGAATAQQKLAAYASVVGSTSVGKAELGFALESIAHPDLVQPWNELMDRWAPLPDAATSSALDLLLARMALDGLWLFDSTTTAPLPAAVRDALLARIGGLVTPGE